jgi:transcriptional regulator EpsA
VPSAPPTTFPLTVSEGERFLQIIAQSSRITRHYELFQLLQSGEVQHFIPHQVLVSAWGDFGGPHLKYDVVSAIQGVRTSLLNRCSIDGLIKDFYKRWLVNRRRPLLLYRTKDLKLPDSSCDCALHKSLQGAGSFLAHGVVDVRDGGDSLYVAYNPCSIVNGHGSERFGVLADQLITQIDAAFRRIAALKSPGFHPNREFPSRPPILSAREEEIIRWVSEGKTNHEISTILSISSFTTKNHMQRILRKLDAANRTMAAAKYHDLVGMQQQRPASEV